MRKPLSMLIGCMLIASVTSLLSFPSVYPTGTTIYDPDRAWNGYTILGTPDQQGAVLIDMNGAVVQRWPRMMTGPGPFRVLPGGFVMGSTAERTPHQETVALVQLDWNGNEVWRFDRTEEVQLQDDTTVWAARPCSCPSTCSPRSTGRDS